MPWAFLPFQIVEILQVEPELKEAEPECRAISIAIEGTCWWAGGRYNSGMASIDIANLSVEERLRLMDELWESLVAKPDALPLTAKQREELDRRLDDLDREGPVGIPWDEVLRRIRRNSP